MTAKSLKQPVIFKLLISSCFKVKEKFSFSFLPSFKHKDLCINIFESQGKGSGRGYQMDRYISQTFPTSRSYPLIKYKMVSSTVIHSMPFNLAPKYSLLLSCSFVSPKKIQRQRLYIPYCFIFIKPEDWRSFN